MKKNKYKFVQGTFSEHEIVRLYQLGVVTVGEARKLLGIDGNDNEEVVMEIGTVIRYRETGIISQAEARHFLGLEDSKPAEPQPGPSTPNASER